MMFGRTTRVTFPEIPVRALVPATGIGLGEGPLMTAMVNVANAKTDIIGARVFAVASEIPHFDLSTLRHRGRETTVTEWEPVPAGMLRIGATLRLALIGGPETVEVLDFLPRYEAA